MKYRRRGVSASGYHTQQASCFRDNDGICRAQRYRARDPFFPEERLDAIDAQLIGAAKNSIDFVGYALTDPMIIDALTVAEHGGVVVRIALDPRERHDFVQLGDLLDSVRIKRGGAHMLLKADRSTARC
jgi:hypothetical protein